MMSFHKSKSPLVIYRHPLARLNFWFAYKQKAFSFYLDFFILILILEKLCFLSFIFLCLFLFIDPFHYEAFKNIQRQSPVAQNFVMEKTNIEGRADKS